MGLRNLLIASVIILAAVSANATDYYVDADAAGGGGCGAVGTPCATIAEVQALVSAGDTVYFDSADTWSASSGTAVLVPIGGVTYIGDTWGAGTRAILEGTSSSISRAVIYFNDDDATYETVVQGFECDGNQYEMDGISILHNGSENVNLTGETKRIENCIVHDVSDLGNWYGYGITIAPNGSTETVQNVEILDNEVYNIGRTAICVYPYTNEAGAAVDYVLVQGNDTHDLGQDRSAAGHGILLKNNISEVEVYCNINRSTGSGGHSIAIEDFNANPPLNLTVMYNIMIDSVYIQEGTAEETFTISDNDVYTPPADPPAFDAYCSAEDTTDPVTVITDPSPKAVTSSSTTLTGTASDANGIDECKWRSGAEPNESYGTSCSGTTAWTCSVTSLSEGANTIYVGCADPSNNWGSDSLVVNYTIPFIGYGSGTISAGSGSMAGQ